MSKRCKNPDGVGDADFRVKGLSCSFWIWILDTSQTQGCLDSGCQFEALLCCEGTLMVVAGEWARSVDLKLLEWQAGCL